MVNVYKGNGGVLGCSSYHRIKQLGANDRGEGYEYIVKVDQMPFGFSPESMQT
jgi:hypothetical protein